MTFITVVAYAVAMLVANLTVAAFGPAVAPLNAFFLIGLDLTLRDWLHTRLRVWQMAALIALTGVLTYLLNPATGLIAIASMCAFSAAALADWVAFAKLRGSWMFRANGSNVVGAAVDSILFPTIAFGVFMPEIITAQFAAKLIGGAVWAYAIGRYVRT
jgi:uncharacterized PurR-regulated membrane protein YhhQ (DUF165 family)